MIRCSDEQHPQSFPKHGRKRIVSLTFRQFRYAFKCDFESIWILKPRRIVENLDLCKIDDRHGRRESTPLSNEMMMCVDLVDAYTSFSDFQCSDRRSAAAIAAAAATVAAEALRPRQVCRYRFQLPVCNWIKSMLAPSDHRPIICRLTRTDDFPRR